MPPQQSGPQIASPTPAVPHLSAVAIVDDDEALCSALALWFGLKGLRVLRFGSAEELLAHVSYSNERTCLSLTSARRPDFSMAGAVLDLNLPGMHGMALANALRDRDAELPIVMITALPPMDRSCYGTPPTGIRCLKKPFDMDELTLALFPTRY